MDIQTPQKQPLATVTNKQPSTSQDSNHGTPTPPVEKRLQPWKAMLIVEDSHESNSGEDDELYPGSLGMFDHGHS